jgi:DNA invertase Pin-like site-specific DNA recombinase
VPDKRHLGREILRVHTPHSAPPMTKAYSYVRFSTPDQAKGDSYRRQTEAANEYAQRNGLALDTEFTLADLGISAFYGANAKTGALNTFSEAVKDGTIAPGSYLLIENLDRLTRADVLEANELFSGIIRRGITLVTLFDQRAYSVESITANPMELIIAILTMVRGHEESVTKSRRMLAVFERKRLDAANGTERGPFTRMLPAWLRWNEAERRHEAIEERACIVRDIFAKTDAGWGKHRITNALNEAQVEPWDTGKKRRGTRWYSSYIKRLLTNEAVVGTFTPHRTVKSATGRKREPLQPIEGYYPAVIDRDLFVRVSAQAKARAARGRHADNTPKSVFTGLLRCARCGDVAIRVVKSNGRGRYVYLVCSKAHTRAGCEYVTARYDNAEVALARNARRIVNDAPRGRDTAEIEVEMQVTENFVSGLEDQAEELADIAATEKSEVARRRLREHEEALKEAREHIRRLAARRDTLASDSVLRRLAAIERALIQKPLDISDVNKVLKQAVSKIVMDAEEGTLTFYWHHAEDPSEPIPFAWPKERQAAGEGKALEGGEGT